MKAKRVRPSRRLCDQFDRYVVMEPNSGCWLWAGPKWKGATGYGIICGEAKKMAAHRYAYQAHVGPIPAGLHICHRCDTPLCVNPAHLFLGTALDNMRDALSKGRLRLLPKVSGSQVTSAKLTEDDVRRIRQMRASGLTQKVVAEQFGVCRSNINAIDNGRSWGHLK